MKSPNISEDAIKFIKDNKKLLCEKFASTEKFPAFINPAAYFMAGSPGAGKTEFSKSFIKEFEGKYPPRKIVRIDADDIRELFLHILKITLLKFKESRLLV